MVHNKYIRMSAINRITAMYPGLDKIPQRSQSFSEIINEICVEYGLARRTAVEYINNAIAKIRIIKRIEAEQAAQEVRIESSDALKVLEDLGNSL